MPPTASWWPNTPTRSASICPSRRSPTGSRRPSSRPRTRTSTSTPASTTTASSAPSCTNVMNKLDGHGGPLVGASTITQQVAKNFLLSSNQTIQRKIKEAMLSLRIEQAYSKDKILELYLNEIYFGLGAYGVASAALDLFRQVGARADARRDRLSGGAAQGPQQLQSVPPPRPGGRAAQLGDRPHGRERLRHQGGRRGGQEGAARRQGARHHAGDVRRRLFRRGGPPRADRHVRREDAVRRRPVGAHLAQPAAIR